MTPADYHRLLPTLRRYAWELLRGTVGAVEGDDLIQSGWIGALEAERRFDPTYGVPFDVFVLRRARGEMIDELRRYGRPRLDSEGENRSSRPTLIHDGNVTVSRCAVPDSAEAERLRDELHCAIKRLRPLSESQCIQARLHGQPFEQIGAARGVCESRAFQLVRRGTRRLREQWAGA